MATQWILFALGCICLATAASRKAQDETYAVYSYPTEHLHRSPFVLSFDTVNDLYNLADRLHMEPEENEPKTVSKRALSVLSRWRPFGNLGVRMNSVHKTPARGTIKMSISPGVDFVSAETRGSARPMGQPLRWGRKR